MLKARLFFALLTAGFAVSGCQSVAKSYTGGVFEVGTEACLDYMQLGKKSEQVDEALAVYGWKQDGGDSPHEGVFSRGYTKGGFTLFYSIWERPFIDDDRPLMQCSVTAHVATEEEARSLSWKANAIANLNDPHDPEDRRTPIFVEENSERFTYAVIKHGTQDKRGTNAGKYPIEAFFQKQR